jgi:hypothetical protein
MTLLIACIRALSILLQAAAKRTQLDNSDSSDSDSGSGNSSSSDDDSDSSDTEVQQQQQQAKAASTGIYTNSLGTICTDFDVFCK